MPTSALVRWQGRQDPRPGHRRPTPSWSAATRGCATSSWPSPQGGRRVDSYQLFLGAARRNCRTTSSTCWSAVADDGRIAYDALHDPELTRRLLQAIADGGRAGPLCFAHEPGADIDTSLDSLVLTGEQSNTSLIFGEVSILKVFRRPSPGPNPDLEVPRALAMRGSTHVAEPLGWIETRAGRRPRSCSASCPLPARRLRRLVAGRDQRPGPVRGRGPGHAADAGGDFAGEAYRLGEATAEVHRDLARAFGTDELPPEAISALADEMFQPAGRGHGHCAGTGPARRSARRPPSPTWPSWTPRWASSGCTATTTWAR